MEVWDVRRCGTCRYHFRTALSVSPHPHLPHLPHLRSGGVEMLAGLLQSFTPQDQLRNRHGSGSGSASVLTNALRCVAVLAATGPQVWESVAASTHLTTFYAPECADPTPS